MAIDRKPWQRLIYEIWEVIVGSTLPIVGMGKVGYMKVGEGDVQ